MAHREKIRCPYCHKEMESPELMSFEMVSMVLKAEEDLKGGCGPNCRCPHCHRNFVVYRTAND